MWTTANPASSTKLNCYLLPLSVSSVELLSFGFALNHWIHGLQVGGVGHERQHDVLLRLAVDSLVKHPKVVFDITGTLQVLAEGGRVGRGWRGVRWEPLHRLNVVAHQVHLVSGFQLWVKLTEDLVQVLADHVSQDVESTAEFNRKEKTRPE